MAEQVSQLTSISSPRTRQRLMQRLRTLYETTSTSPTDDGFHNSGGSPRGPLVLNCPNCDYHTSHQEEFDHHMSSTHTTMLSCPKCDHRFSHQAVQDQDCLSFRSRCFQLIYTHQLHHRHRQRGLVSGSDTYRRSNYAHVSIHLRGIHLLQLCWPSSMVLAYEQS